MAAKPILTVVDVIYNQPDPGDRVVFPEHEDPAVPRIATMPNQAVTGVVSLSGTLTPNHSATNLWAVGIRINDVDYPVTTNAGIWTASVPANTLAPSTMYAIGVTASCNGKNAWPANSPEHFLNFE